MQQQLTVTSLIDPKTEQAKQQIQFIVPNVIQYFSVNRIYSNQFTIKQNGNNSHIYKQSKNSLQGLFGGPQARNQKYLREGTSRDIRALR